MKRIYTIIILLALAFSSQAQKNYKLGGGYYGHFLTHPGFVLEFESETMYTEKASLPFRVDMGVYMHPRNHVGMFVDANYGYRRYFKSGLFIEESIGLGILKTYLNSDGVYEVDDQGNIAEVSAGMPVDLLPSFTAGIGYRMNNNRTLIWMRPKIAWQYPHKTNSLFHLNLQVGFSHTLGKK